MAVNKAIVSAVKKSLSKFDFSRMEAICTNEAQTRMYLIEPLLEILGFSRDPIDMLTEINAGWGKKNNKADIGIAMIKNNDPLVIIECKKYGKNLTDKEADQLNNYFIQTKSSKLGILTNGMIWRFYCTNDTQPSMGLFPKPFLMLDFNEINDELINSFSRFHKNAFKEELKDILEEAQDFFFLQGFEEALVNELSDPSDDLIKAIFNRMLKSEGKRMTEPIKNKIREAINSNAVQAALPKMIELESKNGGIVITTAEELKIYHTVKTIILSNLKKIDPSRISYRDNKNNFMVLVDDNQKKTICRITSNRGKYFLEINGFDAKHEVTGIDSIVNLTKTLKDVAGQFLN
ncbi:MAG: hypothetical protein RLZZ65_1152 [Bacteroidota bacterium]|jgi:hypothetical protein